MDRNPHPKLYFIPGMGADGRLFEGLKREGLEFEVIEFIPPIKGESLREYALRLAEKIDTSKPFVLGGQSLGGVMATEIAQVLKPEKLILISSVKHSREFPFYYKLGRYLPVHRLFSGRWFVQHGPRARVRHLPEWQRDILKGMRRDANAEFVEWAVNAVVNWRSVGASKRLALESGCLKVGNIDCLHIHGTRDLVLPGVFVRGRIKVRHGQHVMVLTHAKEIVAEILRFLGR
jgi:pimeloyl-ACP methyl ester carboxylesterase